MYLCCGDALYDLFVGAADDSATNPMASASRVVLTGDVGGSPLNVATGLARLGHESGYLTKLSTDLFGRRMRAKLEGERLDLSCCIDTGRNTTLAIVETRPDGSARYVFYIDGTADASLRTDQLPPALPKAVRVLHFASYSCALEPTGTALAALAARESARRFISYDPNIRLPVVPDIDVWRERFARFVDAASLVKASDEDIEALYGLVGPGAEERFVADCFDRGVELVFVTRGPDGASGFSRSGASAHSDGVRVDVVDTVGAGDTFQATVLHWLGAEGHVGAGGELVGEVDLEACVALALRAAAITCTRRGADLPRLADLGT